ncbi:MAG: hypothetical protein DRZ79_05130, partial [Candidatus Cloacimonadota bacterium]
MLFVFCGRKKNRRLPKKCCWKTDFDKMKLGNKQKRLNLINFGNLLSLGLIFTTFIIVSCGHKKAPTGGEKDIIKPEIVAVVPEEFSDIRGKDIEITFSKPIDRSTIFTGFYVYPPILKKKFKWNATTLTIQINEELEENTNYFFSFTRKIKGEHKNELKDNYLFVFKSGTLNENRIYGKILREQKEDENYPVFINLMTADSTKIFSRITKNDNYELANLNTGNFLLESFVDKNKNESLDYKKEPYFQTFFTMEKNKEIDIHLVYADTVKPKIKSVTALFSNQLQIKFSEKISRYSEMEITAMDDSVKTMLPILIDYLNKDEILLVTE